MVKKKIAWAVLLGYGLALHLALALALGWPILGLRVLERLGLVSAAQFYNEMLAYQLLVDSRLSAGRILFIGDSQIQNLEVEDIAASAINFGIGGDTIAGVMQRLALYKSLDTARAAVIEIGTNDLGHAAVEDGVLAYGRMLALFPPGLPILVNGVLPVSAAKSAEWRGESRNRVIAAFNQGLSELCAARPGCAFLDPGKALADAEGNLRPADDLGDGLHLAAAGNAVWASELRQALARIVQD